MPKIVSACLLFVVLFRSACALSSGAPRWAPVPGPTDLPDIIADAVARDRVEEEEVCWTESEKERRRKSQRGPQKRQGADRGKLGPRCDLPELVSKSELAFLVRRRPPAASWRSPA